MKCPSRATLMLDCNDNIIGVKQVSPHCSFCQEENIEHMKQRNTVMEYSLSHPLMTNADILNSESFNQLSSRELSNIKYSFKSKYSIPASFEMLENSNNLILAKDSVNRIIVFGLNSAIYFLSASPIILMDATFKIVQGSGQLLIIHCLVNGHCISALFVKMGDKNLETYRKVFKIIQQLATDRNLNVFDREVTVKCDFEKGCINALEYDYKKVDTSGCLFHFNYNITNKCKELGLMSLYRKNASFRCVVRRLSVLALLPLHYISTETFKEVTKLYDSQSITKYKGRYKEFIDYYIRTWLGTDKNRPIFVPKLWNVCGKPFRSNNLCESSHRLLNCKITGTINVIGSMELIKENIAKDMKVLRGQYIKHTKQISRDIDSLLEQILQRLQRNEIDILYYLDSVSEITQIQSIRDINRYKDKSKERRIKRTLIEKQKNGGFSNYAQYSSNQDNSGTEIFSSRRKKREDLKTYAPEYIKEASTEEKNFGKYLSDFINKVEEKSGNQEDIAAEADDEGIKIEELFKFDEKIKSVNEDIVDYVDNNKSSESSESEDNSDSKKVSEEELKEMELQVKFLELSQKIKELKEPKEGNKTQIATNEKDTENNEKKKRKHKDKEKMVECLSKLLESLVKDMDNDSSNDSE